MIKQACMLSILGIALIFVGAIYGLCGLPCTWLGIDCLILGVAYAVHGHRVFGKRADGTLPFWSWVVFLPYLIYTSLVWHLIRLLSREPTMNELSGRLVVARRLLAHEIPPDIANFVDLTAEFQEPVSARKSAAYLSFPLLDAGAPEPGALKEFILRRKPGKTLIHCAQGHGRTGLFALAVLLTDRGANSIEEGLRLLQNSRPRIRLNSTQRDCIEKFASLISEGRRDK